VGTEPHQGVGGRDRPHVRVVEGVRPVTDLGQLLDPNDTVREEGVHGRAAVAVRVVCLGDRHGSNIPYSSVTLHGADDFCAHGSRPPGGTILAPDVEGTELLLGVNRQNEERVVAQPT